MRYIVTSAVAKYRVFTFVDGNTNPDSALVVIASDDAYVLGVLSSSVHRDAHPWEQRTNTLKQRLLTPLLFQMLQKSKSKRFEKFRKT